MYVDGLAYVRLNMHIPRDYKVQWLQYVLKPPKSTRIFHQKISKTRFLSASQKVIILECIYLYIYIYGAELLVHGTPPPPPRRGKGHSTPPPPLWYCSTSRVSWQASRQQNMFQINNKYTTPASPCGTVVLLECRGKQVDSRTCSK